MARDVAAVAAILDRFRAGAASAELTVMALLLETGDPELAARLAAGVPELDRLLRANAEGCRAISRIVRGGLASPCGPDEDVVDAVRRRFDRAVRESEEGSVACYSLGSEAILEAATREVIDEIERQVPLTPSTRVVELGCGIGRFLTALAPRVGHLHGLDVSPGMVAVARRRCAGLSNVIVGVSSGRDLAPVADRTADLVLAVDVLPYVVEAGHALVDAIFAELARVLAPRGVALAFNFSYRADLARDRAEVAALALAHGLAVRVDGTRPLRLWDGALFALASP